jgi:hypothetical protein
MAVSALVARFHTSTRSSLLPAASDPPPGPNDTAFTQSVAPASVPAGTGRDGRATCHSQTLSSWLPAASVRPSGLNATESTVELVLTLPSARGWPGSATSQNRIVPS